MKQHKWTEDEIQFIRQNLNLCDRILAEKLNLSISSVEGLRIRKNIIRPKEQWYFQKGYIPANKGQKMSQKKYDKCKKTMFKPGNIPATTKYFGKPYLKSRKRDNGQIEKTWYIQINKKRMRYLAYLCRENFINLNGKIPRLRPDYDYNKIPEINDIVIISRKENMGLNTVQRYPKPLKRLIQVYGVLNRQLNKTQ